MAIRLRKIKSKYASGGYTYVALCAAETKLEPGDTYLNDGMHTALSNKFYNDFVEMGIIKKIKLKPER